MVTVQEVRQRGNGDRITDVGEDRTRATRTYLLMLLLLGAFGVALYGDAITARHYLDDFNFVYGDLPYPVWHWLTTVNPYNSVAYRPFEAVIYASLQRMYGPLNPVPLHVANIGLHIALSWLVFYIMLHLGFSRLQAVVAAFYSVAAQIQVSAVAGLDTLSQVLGAALGTGSLWLLWQSLWIGSLRDGMWRQIPSTAALRWSTAAFLLALFSKETSFGFVISLTLLLALWALHFRHIRRSFRTAAGMLVPYVTCCVVVLATRAYVGAKAPQAGNGRYDLQFGANIVENVATTLGGWTMPFSSAYVYTAVWQRELMSLALVASATASVLALVVWGISQSTRVERRAAALLLAMSFSALVPVMFMHVSELYLYNSLPFVSALTGIGLGTIILKLQQARSVYWKAPALGCAVTLMFTAHVASVKHKVSLMNHHGESAADLLGQIGAHAAGLPLGGHLLLVEPSVRLPSYSVYLVNGFGAVGKGLRYVEKISGRSDITFGYATSAGDVRLDQLRHRTTVVTLDSAGNVQALPHDRVRAQTAAAFP